MGSSPTAPDKSQLRGGVRQDGPAIYTEQEQKSVAGYMNAFEVPRPHFVNKENKLIEILISEE